MSCSESGHGLEPGPARGSEIGDMKNEIACALLDLAPDIAGPLASGIAGCGMREDGGRRVDNSEVTSGWLGPSAFTLMASARW